MSTQAADGAAPAGSAGGVGGSERPSRLDRALRPFADVRSGEAATALLLMLAVFLLLGAYYLIKPVREALILEGGGAEIKSYTGAIQAALFLLLVPAYGAVASAVNRIRLINSVSVFFIADLLVFFLLDRAGVRVGVPFFLWVGIFNVMVIAQFWSFANDVYTPEQGKRLFAIVGVGSATGAVAGSKVAGALIKTIGTPGLMLTAAAVLCVSLVLLNLVHRRERAPQPAGAAGGGPGRPSAPERREAAERPIERKGGFALVLKDSYLRLIALLMLVLNLVNTNGEYILGKTVSEAAAVQVAAGTAGGLKESQVIGAFYADFQFWQNLLGAAIQLFLVSRVLKWIGVRGALFVLPAIALAGYSIMAVVPVLAYIRIAKIAENSTDYSLQNTVRHSLFLPTSREAKYKAKQAIDSFFWRFGDMLSALAVFVLAHELGLPVRDFAIANVVLIGAWIALAVGIARAYGRLLHAAQVRGSGGEGAAEAPAR